MKKLLIILLCLGLITVTSVCFAQRATWEATITGRVVVNSPAGYGMCIVTAYGTKSARYYKVMNRVEEVNRFADKYVTVTGKVSQPTAYPYRFDIWIESEVELYSNSTEPASSIYTAEGSNEAPFLDKSIVYLPNLDRYPEFYEMENPIHKAVILHRTVHQCSDKSQVGEPQVIKLKKDDGTYYSNYICRSRFEEQCIQDGSFDTYYDEWCEDEYGHKIDVVETSDVPEVEHKGVPGINKKGQPSE
ncbi:MAG: hypothetical protein FJZ10_06440 [Candidatus Omnitrophica bacterium]|nr:hypothetical protein [Candidatus Omnitrophota bacterium]